MKLRRIIPYGPSAWAHAPGHPLYVHRGQTVGRWDNAPAYATWYLSDSAAGAAGEAFGNLATWRQSMFEPPFLPIARRALGVFELDPGTRRLDLDNAGELASRDARPSQVVIRNTAFTQPFAVRLRSALRLRSATGPGGR
ncbi:RES domain-containing protein [Rathayibacter soli]|uniref:RES domain-containing protein n=1 Tax=Rathayibacter soli TaxID=3144168 RepID=UPI0027E541E3|nr:RES domain-containing protein [Glaciibacter superstes]